MIAQTLFQFKNALLNLDKCMVKAEEYAKAKEFKVDVLTGYRLAPDMFPFTNQIQSACDAAKFAHAYLAGKKAPSHPDTETTWEQLRARIATAVAYLNTFSEKDFTSAATTKVSPAWAEGKWMTAPEYLTQVSIPNFYFHMTTAYAIMRHAGVNIGKLDFLGEVNLQK